ncbi:MAG: hypothetical protein SF052_02530 [Bacteroidia bacterium]|nr:hypothetical protein [Bacteroidia bacterium]
MGVAFWGIRKDIPVLGHPHRDAHTTGAGAWGWASPSEKRFSDGVGMGIPCGCPYGGSFGCRVELGFPPLWMAVLGCSLLGCPVLGTHKGCPYPTPSEKRFSSGEAHPQASARVRAPLVDARMEAPSDARVELGFPPLWMAVFEVSGFGHPQGVPLLPAPRLGVGFSEGEAFFRRRRYGHPLWVPE